MSTFPISRRSILAMKIGDPGIAVLIADWTSAEEKDRFEPGKLTVLWSLKVPY